MKRLLCIAVFWFAGIVASLAATLTDAQIAKVDYEQRLGQPLPLKIILHDEDGAPLQLGTLFGERPVILVLAYYDCPNLCTVVLNGLLESLRNLKLDAGRDFEIVVVSIRPGESAALARAKKQTYTTRYGRPGTAHGWHFLTGDAVAIRELTDAAGFHYVYDPTTRQFAHASGVAVATPQGTLSRYFLGIEYPPKDLRLALVEASAGRVGTLADRLLLLCFHYNPSTGKYGLVITRALQVGGIGTVLLLGGMIALLSRRKPRAKGIGSTALSAFSLLPEQASDIARSVDFIFYALLAVCGLVTLAIFVTVTYLCICYRAGSSAPRPATPHSSMAFEIGSASATMLVFLAIFVWAAIVYLRMADPPGNAEEIHVVGKQWMWKVQHPNGRSEINELHLLVNQPVKLLMTSQDVIHDFFVPAFRTKQDVLPARYTMEWFKPTKPGKYRLYCSEYCGTEHARMGGWVYVLEPAEHARWLAGEASGTSIVALGARLFTSRGCSGCHTSGATVRAPLLDGIYGKPVALNGGRITIANEQYLHDSILLPLKDITAGYEPVMPTYQGQLSEEEVLQLVAYIKSLGRGEEVGR